MKYFFLITILLLITGCSSDDTAASETPIASDTDGALYFPPIGPDDWETVSLDALGWDTDAESALLDFLAANGTKAFLLLKDGKIAMEAYPNGGQKNEAHPWYSVGKTLVSFSAGLAVQQNRLLLNEPSSAYLGTGWSSLENGQEIAITVKDHLQMTSGLDFNVSNTNCTDAECLNFLNTPGDFWYYHNAPYTLTQKIIGEAVGEAFEPYFERNLKNMIGMEGEWATLGFANIYYSNARSMARFGLLNLNQGQWENTPVLGDLEYFEQMTSTSQPMNKAYGYFWWINGAADHRLPGSEQQFDGKLIPNAPDDLIAGLGKNDQKLYVVPSEGIVVVRMGESADEPTLGPSGFDNALWEKINALINR